MKDDAYKQAVTAVIVRAGHAAEWTPVGSLRPTLHIDGRDTGLFDMNCILPSILRWGVRGLSANPVKAAAQLIERHKIAVDNDRRADEANRIYREERRRETELQALFGDHCRVHVTDGEVQLTFRFGLDDDEALRIVAALEAK